MYLMVLVLNESELLDETLEKLYEIGITGATVINSQGMGRTICENVPLFGGLSSMFKECRPANNTIFSVIDDEKKINQVLEIVETVTGDLQTAGKGIFFTIPLHQVKGIISTL